MKKNKRLLAVIVMLGGLCLPSSSLADEKEYVNNSIFAIQEEPIEYAYNEEIDSIVNKWFVKLPKDYWYGWNKTEIQNGRAIISSNDGNISTIQTHNEDQTARRSPALRQNVQVEPNKKYILNIEIEKFSGDSSYLVINDEDLSAEVNGFISGPAINNPIFNYSYSKEIVSDANGIVPVSIYMQHAEDKWIYSWAPFNITITKVSITDSTEPSTEPTEPTDPTTPANDKPVITAPNQDYKVGDSIDPLKNVTASDKEDGTTKVTVAKIVDQDGKVIDSIPNDKAGKYTVTYTTTDADGNTVTKDATISVRSNDKPVITAPNQDYKVGDSIDPLKNVTASDKEDGTTKVTVAKIVDQDGKVIDSIPNDKAGKYTVTYTTTDADGNTVTKDATISVRSNDKPVITAPNQDYKVGDSIDPLKNVTASDKEDGTTKVTVAKIVDQDGKVIDSIPNDKAGKYTVTYTTTDADGNTVTKDATISVRSNDKPVITAPNQDYKVGDSIDPLKNVTASDKEDGTTKVTVAKIVDQDGKVIDSIPNDKAGKYTVTYTTTDADGNTVTKDATISVRSNDKPVITAPNQDYKVGDSIDPLKNVTASDKENGTTKVTVAKIVDQDGKVIDSIPNDKAGKYTVTYTTTDADGNTVTKDATISVRSNDKPVITAPNQDYKVGDSIDPLKNVTASDKENGTTKVTVAKIVDQDGKVIDSIPNDKAGKYTVTYTTTDADGNTVTKDATISVRSNDKPVITAPNQDYKVGDSIDPLKNVTASDKEDGTTKVTVAKIVDQDGKVIDSIPNDKAGKYTVTYTTTDADGNTVTKDATISVRSNDKPVITAPNQDYKVGDSIDPLKNVTASDKEDGTTKVTVAKIVDQDGKVIDSIPNDKAGKYTVTYTTTDADGNTVTKDATISVRSNEKPGNGTDNGNPSSNQPGNPSQPSNATNNGVIDTSTNIGSKVNNGAVNSPELPQTGENNRQSQTMSFIGVLLAMFGSLLGFLGIKKRRND